MNNMTNIRPKKDPNAPKRPISAYMFFVMEERPELLNTGMSFAECGRVIGEMWHLLSEAEKAPYHAMAANDRARYEAAMLRYRY